MTDEDVGSETLEQPDPPKKVRAYKRKVPYQRKVPLIPREARGPAREPAKPAFNTITYIPLDQGDPPENLMAGIRFRANVPEDVPRSKAVQQLIVEKFETPDGIRSKAVERLVPLVEVLRGSPWFEIDGKRVQRINPSARLPETSDEYRGWAINWISLSLSADSMDKRWAGEEGLRMRCGCSPSDIFQIRPYFDARHVECAELDKQRHVA